ncbi:substrate-binding periplasmic protein [Psychromonas ossibalaenae]|uniref:substrate-binding periplasmic protein n=1 Tax=Psychromonas ossibalaenae TaxID=444922 RepID=UPI0003806ACD|nr:transporter substrate-binding domain-containing protein [Psychromonas ossibalaenae]
MKLKTTYYYFAAVFFSFAVYADKLTFVTQHFAPFSYEIGHKPAGPAVEVVNAACTQAKIKCEIYVLDWPKAQSRVYSGLTDGLFLIGRNSQREELLHFTAPVMKSEYGFFVKEDKLPSFSYESDIGGLRVGVYGPSNTAKSLRELNKSNRFNIVMFPHDEFSFLDLAAGKLDAVYSNRIVGQALIYKLGLSNVKYTSTHKSINYHIGLSKQFVDQGLAVRFIKAVSEIKKKGYIHKILEKYTMDDFSSDNNFIVE